VSEKASWYPPHEFEEYRLVRPLGAGGMGQVYLAHDMVLDRLVAIKFLATLEPDADARDRFLIEARAAARLQHPNVVAVYRVGEIDAKPYIVSEYLRGKSLAELIRPLPWRRTLELGVELARGLAAAHREGVLHRDIKPSNAVLSEHGTVKLVDFGLAKLINEQVSATVAASAGARALPPAAAAAANFTCPTPRSASSASRAACSATAWRRSSRAHSTDERHDRPDGPGQDARGRRLLPHRTAPDRV